MTQCKNGCGRDVPASKGYKPREFCGDACRVAYGRAHRKSEPANTPTPARIDASANPPGDARRLGREWMRLRDLGDVRALTGLERWIGNLSPEIFTLRATGRWSVWPDNRDSL